MKNFNNKSSERCHNRQQLQPTNVAIKLDELHRYLKKSRLPKFCHVSATSAAFSKGIFAAATNSSNQANKAGCTCHKSDYLS
jgi:hypothetical protein